MLKPYEKLAELYDENWSQFSLTYIKILQILEKKFNFKPQSILDIACGTGYLINTLSTDYEVTGSDISKEMIDIARRNYPKIDFIVSNMKDLCLDKKFDLIMCPFDSINYLVEKQDLKQALLRIHILLNKEGYFLFDFNSESLFKDLHKGSIDRKVKEITFKQILHFNNKTKIAKTRFDFGDGVEEVHIQRAYNYNDIKNTLENNGFNITYKWDIFSDQEVTDHSYKIIIFAGKKKKMEPQMD